MKRRGRPPALDAEKLRMLREWRATPRAKRKRTLAGMAAMLGVGICTAIHGAYGMGYYKDAQP